MKKGNTTITLEKLEKEVESLKKKIFIYETLQSEKEIKQKKIKGPFKNVTSLLKSLKI